MSKGHWNEYHRRWSRLTPPLRPNAEVIDFVRCMVAGHADRLLLLGVTPELADIGFPLIGVDRSPTMIANIWPGDTQTRKSIRADWLEMQFPAGHFSAAVGDGSLNMLLYPEGYRRIYVQLSRMVRPGGRLVARIFMAPDVAEAIEALRDEAMTGRIGTFHAFKWRFAMALVAAAGDPNIAVQTIRDSFNRWFPDRARLAGAAGWSIEDIDTIDVYRDSPEVYSFPRQDQFLAAMPDAFSPRRLSAAGSYELAERCPILVADLAR